MWRIIVFLTTCALAVPGVAESQRVAGLQFERVLVSGSSEVEISQGEETELVMRGSDEDLSKQPFFVDGDVLVLGRSKEHRRTGFGDVQYKLTVRNLKQVELKGSGEVYVKPLQVRDFFGSVEGSGDMKLFDVQAESIKLSVSGSGDLLVAKVSTPSLQAVCSGSGDIALGAIVAEGVEASLNGSGDISLKESSEAREVEINIVGSGDIDLAALNAPVAEVNIMGSGTARIGTVSELEINIVGSGDVYYRGDPDIDKSILGSGDLHRAD